MNRRHFLGASGKFACGFTGATSLLALGAIQKSAAADEKEPGPNIIGPRAPYSPQMGTLV